MGWIDKFKVNVPVGGSGEWKIQRFTVSESDADSFNTGLLFSGAYARRITPGTYTQLICNGAGTVMSDTPAEITDHYDCYIGATGHVLIAGLGLGMISKAILRKDKVESVTVIEKSPDVIKLVSEWLRKGCKRKCEVIQADIFEFAPHKRMKELGIKKFDYAWFDIWNEGCEDYLEEKIKLYRRWGRWATRKGNWLEAILGSVRR